MNNIIVQKFGGTSLATEEARSRVIHHIRREMDEGNRVVVVVSAMGRRGEPFATDTLLEWAKAHGQLQARERDLLLSCGEMISATTLSGLLHEEGISNCVLTGGQAGIMTTNEHTNAQITSIHPHRILKELESQALVIVTGFQGCTPEGDITTLGRGGSDTTATALGVALKANRVDIFTDVVGIMTADPRIVEDATPLATVTYNEICNLAFQGAKVIHPRAVEIAMQTHVPIRVRSTLSDHPGTLVTQVTENHPLAGEMHERPITGIAQVPHVTQIEIKAKEGQYDLQLQVFKAMAENGISVDFINVNPSGVAYTVNDGVADRAEEILAAMGMEPTLQRDCAKVSAVGAGMKGSPGVMSQIVEALTEEDIQILQSADSHTTIWVLVQGEDMVRAVRALHRAFQLHDRKE
ncbi:aspartate kinase [Mechercharimyces sp. CAU 1602]|uniref:aspartate kinase n=1 Tax=Mechercharimyces sp. CAU 1602 TaxID=2973933 RepID=UPI0021634CA3|nr:aspartate kinase [Mechercharimyces sp. CAU 1602]MCS1351257.1 aspartate kinase [Mechercharimyces sp. CAU 1602]